MNFKLSTNIAIQNNNSKAAEEFYSNILGFNLINSNKNFTELYSEPTTIYLQKDNEVKGVVMELMVDDLEVAKEYLIGNGCKIIRWNGKGKDCYIKDPFGVIFNIWEE